MFIPEAQKVMSEGWDIYSSGGGCYHAMKDFKTITGKMVAVEVYYEGGAQMYHKDNEPFELVDSNGLQEGDAWCNYVILAWVKEKFDENNEPIFEYDDIEYTDMIGIFPYNTQVEILEGMKTFVKAFDDYYYNK